MWTQGGQVRQAARWRQSLELLQEPKAMDMARPTLRLPWELSEP